MTKVTMELVDTDKQAVVIVQVTALPVIRGTAKGSWHEAWEWAAEVLEELVGAQTLASGEGGLDGCTFS